MLRILSRGDLLYDFLMTSVQAKMRDVRIDDIERFLCVCVAFPFCMKEYTYIFDRPLVAIQALDLLWLREEGEGESECIYLMDKCLRGQTGRDRAGEVATQDGVETWVHVPIVFFFPWVLTHAPVSGRNERSSHAHSTCTGGSLHHADGQMNDTRL